MEKTRVRAISGWRQVTGRPGIGGRRRLSKPAALQPGAAPDPAESARWEGEGGTTKK
jgi:hypothetical protein